MLFFTNFRQVLRITFRLYGNRLRGNQKGFASPNKGFAKQRPGLQKCGWREAWEWSVAE
jgi:hypothetical protein